MGNKKTMEINAGTTSLPGRWETLKTRLCMGYIDSRRDGQMRDIHQMSQKIFLAIYKQFYANVLYG